MLAILPFLLCLQCEVSPTIVRQLSRIALAMMAMSGRVTMLGLSRWSEKGGSYRTITRFFATVLPWAALMWVFFRTHLLRSDEVYLLAGDETVITKAGKHTYGLDRFFSSVADRPVPGIAFFGLFLISVQQRRSFPIALEQVVRSPEERAASVSKTKHKKAKSAAKSNAKVERNLASDTPSAPAKSKVGRPKGSSTKSKIDVELNPELTRISEMVKSLRTRIGSTLPLTYLVLDGHFGNNAALQMARRNNLHVISKLRSDSALYLPYDGPYSGRGPRRMYGDKLKPRAMPEHIPYTSDTKDEIETRIYQLTVRKKSFAEPLNLVIILKTNLKSGAQSHVLLFSSDLSLDAQTLIDYYTLRFQLEFNFRDAKQHWGMEDFMNISATAVTNAANLSLFMVNLGERVVQDFRHEQPNMSVLDLKAHCRGSRYVEEVIKLLPKIPEPILLERIRTRITRIGRIHAPPPSP